MADPNAEFARVLIEQDLVGPTEVAECLQEIDDRRRAGEKNLPTLAAVLIRKGYLSPGEAEETLRNSPAAPVTSEGSPSYRKIRKIGEGGMGEVWEGEDNRLGRKVAMKFLKGGGEQDKQRFLREAQTAAVLMHPNIAAVFEATDEFIVLQLIDGAPLSDHAGEDRRKVAGWMRDAANAVHYAHEKGVIHRDLKPGNLMLSKSGQVFVMDFGLAKQTELESSISVSGTILGTPAYMSPEQARGELRNVNERSDVYSLGATLYAMIAEKPPFEGPTTFETLRLVEEADPKPLGVDPELELVVRKCLEKNPARRYATAKELAEDLDRYIRGEAVLAVPPSPLYLLQKKIERHRGIFIAGAAGFVAVIIALVILIPALTKQQKETSKADHALVLWSKISGLLSQAEMYVRQGDPAQAAQRFDQAETVCRDFLKKDELPHAHYFLGRIYRARGNKDEARSALEKAIELDPALGEAHFELGLILVAEYEKGMLEARFLQQEGHVEGLQRFRNAVRKLERRKPEMVTLRKKAVAALSVETGRSSYFREVDGLYGQAKLERMQGNSVKAVELLLRVVELDPLHTDGWLTLAGASLDKGDAENALKYADEAVRRNQGSAAAYRIRCLASLTAVELDPIHEKNVERRKQGLEDARRMMELGPKNEEALQALGVALDLNDMDEEALGVYAEALTVNPGFLTAHLNRSHILIKREDYDAAIRECEEALRKQDDYAEIMVNLASALQWSGRKEKAEEMFDRAVAADADYAQSYQARGLFRRLEGRLDDALKDFEEAIRLRPNFAEAHHFRGVTLEQKGDTAGAFAAWQAAVKANPRYGMPRMSLGMAYVQKGQMDEAMKEFTRLTVISPREPMGWLGRGMCHQGKFMLREALADYEKALEVAPPDFPARRQIETMIRALKDE